MQQAQQFLRRFLQLLLVFSLVSLTGLGILFYAVTRSPPAEISPANQVNDVSQLNPVKVELVRQPKSVEEIVALVRKSDGTISIGGARHSMGGQIAATNSLHLDMRALNSIVSYDILKKEITVQAGITWRKLQERIDQDGLSVRIMQSYANFTVGGSLSVNVHGRYVGEGPIINSVRSIMVVLPNGNLVDASPDANADIFYGIIGGYGGLGIIAEVTLSLTDNCQVKRDTEAMAVADYPDYFMNKIRSDTTVVFHNADIYPNEFTQVRAISYRKTNDALTITERLRPMNKDYRMKRFAMWVVSECPGGKWIRKSWGDPAYFDKEEVSWRNYEASADAGELEPTSRGSSTYVLQEYFVPVKQFASFVPAMAAIFRRHEVNVINVSVRHSTPDPGSYLAWARDEVFCFVIYYKQGTSEDDKAATGVWTREMIDAALELGGSYYLPYQIHATREQFLKAYPRSQEFFELKRRLDPKNKFRNKLLEAYFHNE